MIHRYVRNLSFEPSIYLSKIHIRNKGELGTIQLIQALSCKYFYWPFQGGVSFVDHFCYYVSCVSCFLVCSLQPCGHLKGLAFWLSCVWCFIVFWSLLHVGSWVWCGTWLHRFLIFAFFLTFTMLMLSFLDFNCFQFIYFSNYIASHLFRTIHFVVFFFILIRDRSSRRCAVRSH